MVFHVAGAQRVVVAQALEFREEQGRRLAETVDQHVQAPAVRHADHDFLHAFRSGVQHGLVEQGDQAVAAFQRKAFLADVAGVQVFFQALGGGQLVQDAQALLVGYPVLALAGFQPFLQPAALFRVRDMNGLDADAAAVNPLAQRDDVAQFHAVRGEQCAGVELAIHVGRVQAVEGRVQIGHRVVVGQAQRIEFRGLVAADAVGRDQLDDGGFLGVGVGRVAGRDRGESSKLAKVLLDAQAARFRRAVAAQVFEHLRPLRGHALRVFQPVLVHGLDPGGVAARKVGRFLQFCQALACHGPGYRAPIEKRRIITQRGRRKHRKDAI